MLASKAKKSGDDCEMFNALAGRVEVASRGVSVWPAAVTPEQKLLLGPGALLVLSFDNCPACG